MAFPVIVFNNSTGSDTQASGAGPATAVFGTGASLSSSTSVDLSADSPNLSGVATDGSACLWVLTSSGRQFSKITAVNNGTKIVTVETAYGVTESGRTWAIGGKRSTLHNTNSLLLLTADARQSWQVELQYTGTNYMHRSSGSGGITIHSNTAGALNALGFRMFGTGSQNPTLELRPATPGTAITFQSYATVENIDFYMIRPADIFTTGLSGLSNFTVLGCKFNTDNSNQQVFISARYALVVKFCEFRNLVPTSGGGAITITNSNPASYEISDNYFYNVRGISDPSAYTYSCKIMRNIFHSCVGIPAVNKTGPSGGGGISPTISIQNNTFYNGSHSAVVINNNYTAMQAVITGNIFSDNTGYGIEFTNSSALDTIAYEDYNFFYSNSSGSRNHGSVGANSLEDEDPLFVDVANADFTPTNPLYEAVGNQMGRRIDPGAVQGSWGRGIKHPMAMSGGLV